jgi:1-acyl-sn-glycerol-3-phosphate acyltransferase
MPQVPLKIPRNFVRRLLAQLRTWPVVLVFFSTLLLANSLQLLSLLLYPFSRRAFYTFNRWMASVWWGSTVWIAKILYGTRIEISGDPVPPGENALVVANHQEMPDITFLMHLAIQKKRLGDMKWIVKDILKWAPGVGWGMWMLGCVFVKREWTRDRKSIEQAFANIKKIRMPVWLIMFAEGTRFKEKKRAGAEAYGRQIERQPLEHVLWPRTKGFLAAVIGLGRHLDAIYDVTIGYPQGVPTLWQYCQGDARVAHLHVKRIPLSDFPEENKLASWLLDCYENKNRLLHEFYQKGKFP